MKTTISIMGLDALLSSDLDALENEEYLPSDQIRKKLDYVTSICNEALLEATAFYKQF